MMTQISETHAYKLKTQPSRQLEYIPNQNQQKYFNPIVKHTYDSLPKIYGSNNHRKKKYHLNLKSNFQLKMWLQNQNNTKISRKQQCRHHQQQIQTQQERHKAHSCLQNIKAKQSSNIQSRIDQDKTALKKVKNLRISTQSFSNNLNHLQTRKQNQSGKVKKIINFQSLLNLAKPRQKCNNQYCSCKSLYNQYQHEICKKKKQKSSHHATGRKQNNSRLKLPRLSIDVKGHLNKKLDDQQTKHKVNFSRYKVNSLKQEIQLQSDDCFLCRKNKQLQDNLSAKGIIGLIKKRQIQESHHHEKKSHRRAETQSIAIQYDDPINKYQQNNKHQDYATQANINNLLKRNETIDQQVNTIQQQPEKKDFRYLQNNQLSSSSQCSCQHYNLKNKQYQSQKHRQKSQSGSKNKYATQSHKATQNQNQHSYQDYKYLQNKKCNCKIGHKKDERKKRNKKRNKKSGLYDTQQQFQINVDTQSVISQNSLTRHLAHAISPNKSDRKTIFWLLNKKQSQASQNQDLVETKNFNKQKNKNKNKKPLKAIQMINQKTQLFTIPQEQQYVDYLKNYKPIQKNFKLKNLFKSDNFRIIRYNDTLYIGQMENNSVRHGQALFITPKQIFQGYYQNGIKMSGCQRNIDGVYIGEFLNGLRHGKGKFVWNNGQVFQGQYKLGTKNGYGVWKSPKGDSYQGQWKLNRQHGIGVHRHKSSVYKGQFKNSCKDGQGQQTYLNGDKYIGTYHKGKAHGKGKYEWKDGSVYQGQFYEGLREGYGVWNDTNNFIYQGEFKRDLKHGKGKQTYPNGDVYEGQFRQGLKINGKLQQKVPEKQSKTKSEKKL